MVQMVGRGDVDGVHTLVAKHRVEALVRGWQAQLLGACACALAGRAHDAVDLDAEPAESLDVDHTDETDADDGGAYLMQALHAHQFRCAFPLRADGRSFGLEAAPHHATALAITRCTSGWW